jgi:hypothetical protein
MSPLWFTPASAITNVCISLDASYTSVFNL